MPFSKAFVQFRKMSCTARRSRTLFSGCAISESEVLRDRKRLVINNIRCPPNGSLPRLVSASTARRFTFELR
jgi:hypothetical protein